MMKEKIRILYVDDEVRNVTSFKRSFRRMYNIHTATSAQEGMELMKDNTYEIVLTDQRMPEMTGVDFLTAICDEYPDSMRILITAYTDIAAVIEAINKGKVYKYVNKPYEEEDLIRIFEEAYQVYQYRLKANEDYKKYKDAFINSSEPIFLINTRGEFMDVNESCLNLLGHTRSSMFNTPLSYFFVKKRQKRDFMMTLKENDKVEDFEALIKTKDGNIDCLMSLKKQELGPAKVRVFQGSLKNISRLKAETSNLISEIVEKQEYEKQMLAQILHESLAQKLAGIKFYMSTLKDIDQSSHIDKVISTTNSALDRAFEELRNVCFDLVPRSLDLGLKEAVQETIDRLEGSFQVTIDLDFEQGTPELEGNRMNWFRAIQEVLYHLVEEHPVKHIEVASDMTSKNVSVTTYQKLENNNSEWFKMFEQKLNTQKGEVIRNIRDDRCEFSLKF